MAEMNTIIDVLGTACAEDTAIDTWAKNEYSQGITTFENMDPRDEPEPGSCPMVIICPLAKSGGLSKDKKGHVLDITCVVYDENKVTSTAGMIRFTGGRNVETLRSLVVDVVMENAPADLSIESISTEYDVIDQFPFVSCGMVVTLTEEKTIGSDPLE